MRDPFQDEKSEDVDRLRELHEDIFENFKTYVRDRRGDRLKAAEETLFTGDIWTGNQALEVGLIDGLAEMRPEMRKRYGDKVKFQRAGVRRLDCRCGRCAVGFEYLCLLLRVLGLRRAGGRDGLQRRSFSQVP